MIIKRIFRPIFALLTTSFLTISITHATPFQYEGLVVPAIGVDVLPYEAVDPVVAPTIVLMGRINRFFIEGNRVGYLLTRTQLGAVSAVAQVRSHQYIPEGNEIPSREKAFESGLQLAKPISDNWTLQTSLFTDISNTHRGQELEAGLYRRDSFGDVNLLTYIAMQYQTKQLSGYYINTESFQAKSAISTEVEFILTKQITKDIEVVAITRIYHHDSNYRASPLVSGNLTQRYILGIGWRF